MGALGVLMAIGLFDVQGGAALKPTYQITSPIFDHVTICVHPGYCTGRTFTITTSNNSAANQYIQSARLNGSPLNSCLFRHEELVKGGALELELGSSPNRRWGVGSTARPAQSK